MGAGGRGILECKLGTIKHRLMLAVDPIILTNIHFQSPSGQYFLVFCQPWSCAWQVGYDEEGEYSDEDLLQAY